MQLILVHASESSVNYIIVVMEALGSYILQKDMHGQAHVHLAKAC